MSTAIWKYNLYNGSSFLMPQGAKIVAVREQDGCPCMWAMVDTKAPQETRSFVAVGTGFEFPDTNVEYLGMCHFEDGAYVIHVLEVKK